MKNCVKFDWFEFTLFVSNPDYALSLLNMRRDEFVERSGRNGYKRGISHVSKCCDVFYDGSENMGIHFVFSGASMDFFYDLLSRRTDKSGQFKLNFRSRFYLFRDWYMRLAMSRSIKVSRLDVAFDDYSRFNSRQIWAMNSAGMILSNWRKFQQYESCDKRGNLIGHTGYYGSRSSDVFLRVYDKKLEQECDDLDIWTRYEFVLKNDYASAFLNGLFQLPESDLMPYYCGLFKKYFYNIQIIECFSALEPFNIGKLSKPAKSISTVLAWFNTAVAPSVRTLIKYAHGDMSWLYESISNASSRRDEEYLLSSAPA